MKVPSIALASTHGAAVDFANVAGTSVLFIYPYTGRPGFADPPGWDDIPGAHGSTPQALGFSKLYDEFKTLNVKIFGLSFMTPEWQQDFSDRNALPYPLVSDQVHEFADAMKLETFRAGDRDYLKRRCFILRDGEVVHDITDIPQPAENAAQVLKLLSP
jgi:peroxiredoxin